MLCRSVNRGGQGGCQLRGVRETLHPVLPASFLPRFPPPPWCILLLSTFCLRRVSHAEPMSVLEPTIIAALNMTCAQHTLNQFNSIWPNKPHWLVCHCACVCLSSSSSTNPAPAHSPPQTLVADWPYMCWMMAADQRQKSSFAGCASRRCEWHVCCALQMCRCEACVFTAVHLYIV